VTRPLERGRPSPGAAPAGSPVADPAAPAAVVRVTSSAEETERLGEWLAAGLVAGDVLVLSGPLGSGKTRLVAGLARGLGIRSRVRSPSFTLLNEYRGSLVLHHLDLYRLEAPDVDGLGLEELVDEGVLAVEWGERLPAWLREEALALSFEVRSEHGRAIGASPAGARGAALLAFWRSLPAGASR
jgi:tRNA threonylcarbamoyladenosine biosynthesis protein TsaE